MDGPSSARSFADNLLGLVPANLLAGCTADLAAQAVPSLADGAPSRRGSSETTKKKDLVVREIAKTYEFRTLGKADLTTEVDRLCAFSTVPAKDKELLKFLLKSYNTAHALAKMQLNLVLATFTQVQEETTDWADGGSDDPFTLERYAPQAWALLQVLIASITYPVVKLSVELVNMIAGAYARSKVPAITPYSPATNLVRVEIDQAALLKKRSDEIATLTLMNRRPRKPGPRLLSLASPPPPPEAVASTQGAPPTRAQTPLVVSEATGPTATRTVVTARSPWIPTRSPATTAPRTATTPTGGAAGAAGVHAGGAGAGGAASVVSTARGRARGRALRRRRPALQRA